MQEGSYLIRRTGTAGEFAFAINLDGKGGTVNYFGKKIKLAPFEHKILTAESSFSGAQQ